jgi:hypothetical protein
MRITMRQRAAYLVFPCQRACPSSVLAQAWCGARFGLKYEQAFWHGRLKHAGQAEWPDKASVQTIFLEV